MYVSILRLLALLRSRQALDDRFQTTRQRNSMIWLVARHPVAANPYEIPKLKGTNP
jgi:hypothetical protein